MNKLARRLSIRAGAAEEKCHGDDRPRNLGRSTCSGIHAGWILARSPVPDSSSEPTQAFSVGTWVSPHLARSSQKTRRSPGVILSAADAGQNQRGWQSTVPKQASVPPAHTASDNASRWKRKKSLREGHGITCLPPMTVGQSRWRHLHIDGHRQELSSLKMLSGNHAHSAPTRIWPAYPMRLLCVSRISGFPVLFAQALRGRSRPFPSKTMSQRSSKNRSRRGPKTNFIRSAILFRATHEASRQLKARFLR